MAMKWCSGCERDRPTGEFYKNRSKKDGLANWCRECTKTYNNAGRSMSYYFKKKAANPVAIAGYQRRTRLKNRYGLTEDDYDVLNEMQAGRCAICLNVPDYRLFVDHDHATGKVRGLLCSKCNGALGWLENNADRIGYHLQVLSPPETEDGVAC